MFHLIKVSKLKKISKMNSFNRQDNFSILLGVQYIGIITETNKKTIVVVIMSSSYNVITMYFGFLKETCWIRGVM